MSEYVKTVDKLAEGQSEVQIAIKTRPGERNRLIARDVIRDLGATIREMPGWTEHQKSIIRKAMRELEAIR